MSSISTADIVLGIVVLSLGVSIGLSIGLYQVTSGSMSPQINEGETVLVFHSAHDIFIDETGSIIVFKDTLETGSEKYILHRTVYYAEEGENWVDDVPQEYLVSTSCEIESYCPAPTSGYITKGDANNYYDQSGNISPPVQKDDIIGFHVRTFEWQVPEVVRDTKQNVRQ
jgi:signal peptidase